MAVEADVLPSSVDELHALVTALRGELEAARREREEGMRRLAEIETLLDREKAEYADLKRAIFGRKREKIGGSDPKQGELFNEAERDAGAAPDEERVQIVRRRVGKKGSPCPCDGFEERGAKAVVQASPPTKILPGSTFSNRSIAFFVVGKYADALPFRRQEKMLSRIGFDMAQGITHVGCRAHIRRELHHVYESQGHSPFALEAITMIRELYHRARSERSRRPALCRRPQELAVLRYPGWRLGELHALQHRRDRSRMAMSHAAMCATASKTYRARPARMRSKSYFPTDSTPMRLERLNGVMVSLTAETLLAGPGARYLPGRQMLGNQREHVEAQLLRGMRDPDSSESSGRADMSDR